MVGSPQHAVCWFGGGWAPHLLAAGAGPGFLAAQDGDAGSARLDPANRDSRPAPRDPRLPDWPYRLDPLAGQHTHAAAVQRASLAHHIVATHPHHYMVAARQRRVPGSDRPVGRKVNRQWIMHQRHTRVKKVPCSLTRTAGGGDDCLREPRPHRLQRLGRHLSSPKESNGTPPRHGRFVALAAVALLASACHDAPTDVPAPAAVSQRNSAAATQPQDGEMEIVAAGLARALQRSECLGQIGSLEVGSTCTPRMRTAI